MYDSVFSSPSQALFRAAIPKHVNTRAIKINLNRLENGGIQSLKNAFSRAVSRTLKDLEKAIEKKDVTAISEYKFSAIPEIEQAVLGMWLGGWGLGGKHGKNELTFQKKANFDEDLLDAERLAIENVYAQDAVNNRANTLAQDISNSQWGKIQQHLLDAVQPQADTGNPISRSELLKRINTELGDSGFGKRAERIARTELTFAYNAGRLNTYKDSGLVSHVVFLSILDDRRCQICEDRHGMTIALDDVEGIAANTPPMHVNCRCVLSPRLATPENRQEIETDERQSRKRKLFDAPPKWLAAGILAAILLSQGKGKGAAIGFPSIVTPGIAVPAKQLADVALAAQIQKIATATGEISATARQRRANQTAPLPSQEVIEIQPRVILNGIDLNSATAEEIRETLKEILKPEQIDDLIEYLSNNKITSVDDLLAVKGISKKSKTFKLLQDLADKERLKLEIEKITSPSELWLKNWGFSRSEAKTIFDEVNNKPPAPWKELQQRLKKRGISSDKIQRAIDKIKSIEAQEKRQVVGLDDWVDLVDNEAEQNVVDSSKLIKQREITEQRRREALQEIKELQEELQQVRSEESRFNVRIRRMNRRNPKDFITQQEVDIRDARQMRLQQKVETAQQKALDLGRQLERAKLALNQLDIPNLTPEAKNRTQTVENLGLEGTQLSNAVDSLTDAVRTEVDSQLSKGLNSPKRVFTNLEKTVNRTAVNLQPAQEVVQKTNLNALQERLETIQESYQRLLDPLYPDNYFGRDIQNELTSLKAELRRTKGEIDAALRTISRSEQALSTATAQTEQQLGRLKLLKIGNQLEKQAQDLDNQLQDYAQRVKRTENFEKTIEPFSPTTRQQPLEQMGRETAIARDRIPSFKKEVETRIRPELDKAKSQLSEIAQQKERLKELQTRIDSLLGDTQKLPITKSQIPTADNTAYAASVELRKLSREIQEETQRFKTLAGVNRVNLDDNIKTQNRTYQEYEKQRFGDDKTPSWEQNVSPAVEARLNQIESGMKRLEAIAEDWNLGFLIDLGQYIEAGTDATGKTLRVRRWLDSNGLSPEDLTLSGSSRKVGYDAIRDLADETIRQMAIVRGGANALRENTQFKAFTERGSVTEADYLKWAEGQTKYWQQQQKKVTSDNWQGSSYERLDQLNKKIDTAKATDVELRKSIQPDDAQGQLRRTVAKYQDWQRKYTAFRDTGLEGQGLRQIDDAQRRLNAEQASLLDQADRYIIDAQNLIDDNADNAREIWEKIRRDSQQPVFFDVKGKAIERGQLLKQLDEIDNKLNDYRKMQEIKVEPLTYSKAAAPLVKERQQLNQRLTELQPQIDQLESQIAELKTARRGTKKLESQLSKLQLEKQNNQQRLTDTIQEIRDLRLVPKDYQQVQVLKQQLAQTQSQINQIQSLMASTRKELETLKTQPLGGSASGRARQGRVEALEDAIARQNNDLFTVVRQLNQLKQELGAIRNASRD